MNLKAIFIASLGGFQFGFNTAVISGAILFFIKEFPMSKAFEGFAISIILIGALLGASFAGKIANTWGRKKAFFVAGILFILGTLFIFFSKGSHEFIVGRFIQGLGVGLVSVICPMYLAEIAPVHKRGFYVSFNQFAVVVGILFAYIVNYIFAQAGSWRIMFGVALIPALLQIFGLFFIPESSVWKGPHHVQEPKFRMKELFANLNKKLLIIGVLLSIFQQITGLNAVFYFAPQIFESAGFGTAEGAIFATLGIGVINMLATIIVLMIIDKVGRRSLLLIGLAGMAISLFVLALGFFVKFSFVHILSVICLMSYIGFAAISIAPVVWLIIAEIYPSRTRAHAMSVATCANWLSNYLVALTFLLLVEYLSISGTFALFGLLSIIAFLFCLKWVPETKGTTLS